MKKRELKNRIQNSGGGLQDYAADIRRLAQEAYPSMDPEFVENAAVESFVDGNPRLGSAIVSPHAFLQKRHYSTSLCIGRGSCPKSISQARIGTILSNLPRYRYYRTGIDTFAITNSKGA